MYVVGNALAAVALAFTAQSVIAPLQSITMAANAIFAPWLLHEKISRNDIIGTIMLILGAVLSVAFGDQNSTCMFAICFSSGCWTGGMSE